MSDLINLIHKRQSTPLLTTPAPTMEEWHNIIQAGITAPDHGRLKPWQFRLIEDEQLKKLGQLFSRAQILAYADDGKTPTEQQLTRTESLPLRAPAILVVVATVDENNKIPVTEQICAVAAATQNIQLALQDFGYGCMWRTGDFASYDEVKTGLGFEPKDEIIGFLYVGTPEKEPPLRTPQSIESCFQSWQAPT